jgi:hypothetical protein
VFKKNYFLFSENFPNICLEVGANAIQKYYQAKDLIIGKTIFVLGRRCVHII